MEDSKRRMIVLAAVSYMTSNREDVNKALGMCITEEDANELLGELSHRVVDLSPKKTDDGEHILVASVRWPYSKGVGYGFTITATPSDIEYAVFDREGNKMAAYRESVVAAVEAVMVQ